MKIASIALRTPSLEVSNESILSLIARHNTHQAAASVTQYQREVALLLRRTGSVTRFYRDLDRGEKALDFITDAITAALAGAALDRSDVDLLIYCGVGRGFIEPANAYFIAEKLGLHCQGFDLTDACMSWTRALELAGFYLQCDGIDNVLVVNGEFTVYEHGYPQVFTIGDRNRLAYTFPAYTIGEGATATLVRASDQPWRFDYQADPSAAALCNIPLQQYADFSAADERLALNGIGQFVSFGAAMFERAEASFAELIGRSAINLAQADLIFPHGAAARPVNQLLEKLGIPKNQVFNEAFASYGNLISASIPAAMLLAEQQGRLRRGMQCAICPASAGMSFALAEFTY